MDTRFASSGHLGGVQREALTYITAALLETGKAPTMAQLRERLGLKSRNSAHTIVLALEAAGEIVVTRFAIALPGTGPATYEEGLSDGRAQGLASLDVMPGEEAWARDVIYHAKRLRENEHHGAGDALTKLGAAVDAPMVNQKST